jgi:hypothetical protein
MGGVGELRMGVNWKGALKEKSRKTKWREKRSWCILLIDFMLQSQ